MKKLWSKANFILISILLISSVVSPVLGTGIINNDNRSYVNYLELNTNELSIINSNSATDSIIDSNSPNNNQEVIFGDLLIKELATHVQNGVTEIKTIMLFEESSSKSERIEVIDNALDE